MKNNHTKHITIHKFHSQNQWNLTYQIVLLFHYCSNSTHIHKRFPHCVVLECGSELLDGAWEAMETPHCSHLNLKVTAVHSIHYVLHQILCLNDLFIFHKSNALHVFPKQYTISIIAKNWFEKFNTWNLMHSMKNNSFYQKRKIHLPSFWFLHH